MTVKQKKLSEMFKIIQADLHHLNELANTDDLSDEIKNLTENISYVEGYLDAILENIVDPLARPPLVMPDLAISVPKSLLDRIKQAFTRQTLIPGHSKPPARAPTIHRDPRRP